MANEYTFPEDKVELPTAIYINGRWVRPSWVEITTYDDMAHGERSFVLGEYEVLHPGYPHQCS